LTQVIIDEAHLALSHNHFCHIMHTCKWLSSLSCQIVLLLGSCDPSLVKELFVQFGITQYIIFHKKNYSTEHLVQGDLNTYATSDPE
jgi:hypothetical protein